jgi:hypothetical protein
MMEDFTLSGESNELMSALGVVRDILNNNAAESLQLESSEKNNLEDSVDFVYNTYRAREIYQSALERMINEVDWSEEDFELLKLHNGGRYWETLDEDLAGDVDDFHDKVWGIFEGFTTEMDGDFNINTLDEYVSTADMFYYLEDGLRERYGY